MKKQKKKSTQHNPNEVVGICTHPNKEHQDKCHITREKAKKKCLKQFKNPCKHFIQIGR